MRRTLLREPVFQPGDDFIALWTDLFMEAPEGLYARFIEEDAGVWGCELADVTREVQVNDFPTEEALRAWLTQQEIDID